MSKRSTPQAEKVQTVNLPVSRLLLVSLQLSAYDALLRDVTYWCSTSQERAWIRQARDNLLKVSNSFANRMTSFSSPHTIQVSSQNLEENDPSLSKSEEASAGVYEPDPIIHTTPVRFDPRCKRCGHRRSDHSWRSSTSQPCLHPLCCPGYARTGSVARSKCKQFLAKDQGKKNKKRRR